MTAPTITPRAARLAAKKLRAESDYYAKRASEQRERAAKLSETYAEMSAAFTAAASVIEAVARE